MTTDEGVVTRSITYQVAKPGPAQISRVTDHACIVKNTISTSRPDEPVRGIIATSMARSVSIDHSTNK